MGNGSRCWARRAIFGLCWVLLLAVWTGPWRREASIRSGMVAERLKRPSPLTPLLSRRPEAHFCTINYACEGLGIAVAVQRRISYRLHDGGLPRRGILYLYHFGEETRTEQGANMGLLSEIRKIR